MSIETEKFKLKRLAIDLHMDEKELDKNINDIIRCIINNNPEITLVDVRTMCEACAQEITIRLCESYKNVRNSPASEEFLVK